jgi:type IV pilus assembly protein PilB
VFRKEFISVVTNTGMMTLKELRPFTVDKDFDAISEFDLLKLENFDDVKFAKHCAEKHELQFIDLQNARIPDKLTGLIKKKVITKFRIIPVQKTDKSITLATFDPSIKNILPDLRNVLRQPVDLILTSMRAWKKIYDGINESIEELVETIREIVPDSVAQNNPDIKEEDIGQDIIRYVNQILAEAYVKGASDIHIEPYEKDFRIRLRIDGKLIRISSPPIPLMLPIISRIKIMSQMDISEKRKPQDGRIKLQMGGKAIDYRVSTMPTLFGEKIVMRLLDSSNLKLDMRELGFEAAQLEVFLEGIHRPYGMCLVTGPTGSGKTTTLYSALAELNKITSNISTAEDPVEFNIGGINQVNVKKDIGLDFKMALKTFLRQDPDIIMVGEIRDGELGEIAIEAALTGHMVLSTIHTNDAASTVTRLIQMEIEPFLVVAALNVVVAQRLCRRICENCKEIDHDITAEALISAGISANSAAKLKVYHGKGCAKCNDTGYKGRVAIYEVLRLSPAIRELVLKGASSDQIKLQSMKEGMRTLRMSALTKVAQGQTTLEEAITNSTSDKV